MQRHLLIMLNHLKEMKTMSKFLQKELKLFLNKKAKQGDVNAILLRVALEIETRQENALKYPNYKIIGNKMEDACKAYLDHSKKYGLKYGMLYRWEEPLPVSIIATLPNGNTIAYRCSNDLKWSDIPQYMGDWNHDFNNNRAKIEQNIIELYGDEICDYMIDEEQMPCEDTCPIVKSRDIREDFCGLGMRKVKLFLSRKAKQGDEKAKSLRIDLELATQGRPYIHPFLGQMTHRLVAIEQEIIELYGNELRNGIVVKK